MTPLARATSVAVVGWLTIIALGCFLLDYLLRNALAHRKAHAAQAPEWEGP